MSDNMTSWSKWSDNAFILELLKYLPAHVFWKDKGGVYLGCNANFAQSLGLDSPQDIIGKTDYDLPVEKKDSDLYREDDKKVMQSRQPKLDIEEEQTLLNGDKIYLLTSKVPLFNKKNEVTGILGIYSDITELKKTQQKLQKEKLRAEAASDAKSEFIANMSHDIRTPITGILGLAESLENNAIVSSVKEDAHLLIGATKELLGLLNGIIEVVSLDADDTKVINKIFSIEALVAHNFSLLYPAAKHKNLDFKYSIDDNIPHLLKGDSIALDRIILNLLSNAIKFTDTGHVTLTITLKKQEQDKVELLIQVEDTGIGIPSNKSEAIFESFSRLNPSHQGIYKGDGIGLYTVKKHVEVMKGSIEVKSQESYGTVFSVQLPFTIPETVNNNVCQPGKGLSDIQQKEVSCPTAKLLIVEDNALALRMVVQLFTNLGCPIETAETGEEAVALAIEKEYELILMDIGLPNIDGYQATAKIREASSLNKSTPIIALTGHLSNEAKQLCIDSGMQDMLSKPLDQNLAKGLLIQWC